MQQNLEQIRAGNALKTATAKAPDAKVTKASVSKLPAMILTNGLLAAVAFATEEGKDSKPKRGAMSAAVQGLAGHLGDQRLHLPPLTGSKTSKELLDRLTGAKSLDLQRATDEALAFLGYLKRFAPSGKDEGGES